MPVQAHATGWVAYRVDLPDDPDEPEVTATRCLDAELVGVQVHEAGANDE
jgi:hypothetical protein